MSLWDPLGCSDLSQILFGSSPIATDWDKTVAEIIHTTFVFLGHPKEGGLKKIIAQVIFLPFFPLTVATVRLLVGFFTTR